jgi:hypothetical protein
MGVGSQSLIAWLPASIAPEPRWAPSSQELEVEIFVSGIHRN